MEVEGKENGWEQLSRLFSFSFLSTRFRLPSLHSPHTPFGVGNTDYTALETSHVETICLQAGGCGVKGEKTSISVGEEKISWISRDRLIPKCLSIQTPLNFCKVKKKKKGISNSDLLSFQYRYFLYIPVEYAYLNNLLKIFRFCHRYSRYGKTTQLGWFYSALKSRY